MSRSVKISDNLMRDARLVGEAGGRTTGRQIELWARLGCAVEPFLSGDKVSALLRAGDAKPLSKRLRPEELGR